MGKEMRHSKYMNEFSRYRGYYTSANVLYQLRKRDKMRGLPSILSLFRDEFNKFNNTGA